MAILGAMLSALVKGQTASIYTLESADAAEGRKLFDAMEEAEHKYNVWAKRMAKKVRGVEPDAKDEGLTDLNFAPDFKTAIPKSEHTFTNGNGNTLWGQQIAPSGNAGVPIPEGCHGYDVNGETVIDCSNHQ